MFTLEIFSRQRFNKASYYSVSTGSGGIDIKELYTMLINKNTLNKLVNGVLTFL